MEKNLADFFTKILTACRGGVPIGKGSHIDVKKSVINSKVMVLFLEENISHEDYSNQLRVIL